MTATTPDAAQPVAVLIDHVSALASAIDDCAKNPTVKLVHRLRTGTRRIEGQLALFAAVPDLTQQKHKGRLRVALKDVRRAAGRVRDLDVQMEMLDALRPGAQVTAWRRDRSRLHRHLEEERKVFAKKLIKVLRREGKAFKKMLEELVNDLQPAKNFSLEPQPLAELARAWFATRLSIDSDDSDDPVRLHAIRKAAKLARYIAENAPDTRNLARELAGEFESLQVAGGTWHDELILSQIAAEEVGSTSPLTNALTKRCLAALQKYRKRLRTVLHQISSTPLRLTAPAAPARALRARALRRN